MLDKPLDARRKKTFAKITKKGDKQTNKQPNNLTYRLNWPRSHYSEKGNDPVWRQPPLPPQPKINKIQQICFETCFFRGGVKNTNN